MQKASHIKMFAGPSLSDHSKELLSQHHIELLPPIRRFDLPKHVSNGDAHIIIIVDGYFYQDMAVGHAELMEALQSGISIYGLSSMGAIRAFEMRDFGMKGFGSVYEWFFQEQDFQDDEVTLIHEPMPPYRSITEPMVHYRECIRQLEKSKKLTDSSSGIIIDQLKQMFFGDRTLDVFSKLLEEHSSVNSADILENFDQFRIKKRDLEKFLELKVWTKN